MDPSYDPLNAFNRFSAKVDFVMNNFDELIPTLIEKRAKLEKIHDR